MLLQSDAATNSKMTKLIELRDESVRELRKSLRVMDRFFGLVGSHFARE